MKIQCLTTFLEGADRFEEGDIRTVQDDVGVRLVANGWAKDVTGEVATGAAAVGESTLDIQNLTASQEVPHG